MVALVMMLYIISSFTNTVMAANSNTKHETWTEVATEMGTILDKSYKLYVSGDTQGAKKQVDYAYYSYYEKLGFEKTVMAHISGSRATAVEYQFSFAKKAILGHSSKEDVKASLDKLKTMLLEDATQLDGTQETSIGVFLASLLIITREGFEAIIIVGAIIAYLLKSGNKEKTKAVYLGSVVALALSVVMAYILNSLAGANGQSQEIIEGMTMLLAVVVLFYVSNWMVSKSEAEVWSKYIESKVEQSISKGSMFSLAFAAFLAVFREGAETILFYQALLAGTKEYTDMVWLGLGVGCILLVIIYILIRVISIKLPLKPFFLGTSILLAVMAVSFMGSAVKELQEGNMIGVTPIAGMGSVELLGIYPTLETLIPQIILVIITAFTFFLQFSKNKKNTAMH